MPVKVDEYRHPDDIVISGISGSFPESDNIEEFENNLFDGKNMISTSRRWDSTEAARKLGIIRNIDRFDNDFFHMDRKQAKDLSVHARLLLEKCFEAFIDAGYNLQQIKGKNIAVICGQCDNCTSYKATGNKEEDDADGCAESKFHNANIISYHFDLKGPSTIVDSACSTSLTAIDYAVKMLRKGECDAALVCSLNISLSSADEYARLGIMNSSGINKVFDADGNGFSRSESVVAIYLQKRKDARRIYANLIHSKINCDGFKPEGISFPSVKEQKNLYEGFYKEININPSAISFLEAHGTATQVGDYVEGTSIEEFFCANRETPLKIGSVKSNMGHSEACAGMSSLSKMIISFEKGMIPPNLHFNTPNPNIKGFQNGKLEVITKPTPIEGEYFAINSFGFGGSNGHILLSPHDKIKKKSDESVISEFPRLVTVSGRTENGLNCFFNSLENNRTDFEYIRLIHEIFSENIDRYIYRGYIILNANKSYKKSRKLLTNEKRPLWFMFAGAGSQWPAMGVSLMKIPIFAQSIHSSHKTLESKGVNLLRIITSNDPLIITNTLNSFVGIVAIQIALVDVLNAVGVKPDGIIGHSLGEISCAYADGCVTADQAILLAYSYGLISLEGEFIHTTTAVVGRGYSKMKNLVPRKIDIISHNSPTCCTISGPTDIMQEFMEQLDQKNIEVREVHTSNVAYNSHSIISAASKLTSYFEKIISKPKVRSKKWLCTSAPENLWFTKELQHCTAQYFANNFLNPVYFEETCRHIPYNAVVVEISPYAYLNDILKCTSSAGVENIPLTTKSRENGVEFLLNSLGQIYETGYDLKLHNLYPAIEFPVSKSTPMISPLIKWRHDECWPIGVFEEDSISIVRDVTMNSRFDADKYITGHIIDGRNLFPGFGYIHMVWETVGNMLKRRISTLPIVFENVRFERVTNVSKNETIEFRVTVHLGTNMFEISEKGALVVSGNVRIPTDINQEILDVEPFEDHVSNSSILPLNTKDFYKELRLKGYHYKELFKKVVYANAEGTYGKVSWCDNFTTFMDTMAQLPALYIDCRELLVPTYVQKIIIDVEKHYKILENLDKENPELSVNFYPDLRLINSGGVQMISLETQAISRRRDKADPILEESKFIPYISDEEMNLNSVIRLCVHIALENVPSIKVKTYELLNAEYSEEAASISNIIAQSLTDLPLIQANVNVLTTDQQEKIDEIDCPHGIKISNEDLPNDNESLIIVLSDIRNKVDILEKVFKALNEDGFIITKESRCEKNTFEDLGFTICFNRRINTDEEILLLRKKRDMKSDTTESIRIKNDSYSWISEVQNILMNIKPEESKKLILYAEKDPINGILGFFNCLRKEEKGGTIRCFFILDETAPDFTLKNTFYKSQFEKNLSINVFKNGYWGSYRHLPLDPVEEIETENACCYLQQSANLSSFRWMERRPNLNRDLVSKEIGLVHTYFSSLNFRDIMIAVGRILPVETHVFTRFPKSFQGLEYSGKDSDGRRIMGMLSHNGIATVVEPLRNFFWMVPDNISLEEAATIPVIYCTVIYALFFKIQLKKGTSILIHAGAGGIGLAAINICLHYECDIYTTVGTAEKIEFLKRNYPQIPENHICNSRDTSFEKVVMEQTKGRGVDVVLNSLSEEKLNASIRCLAKGGHFIEIGKYDITKNNSIEMGHFLKDITFHSLQLDRLTLKGSELSIKLQQKLQQMLNEGIVKPIHRTIFQIDEVENAFRYLTNFYGTEKNYFYTTIQKLRILTWPHFFFKDFSKIEKSTSTAEVLVTYMAAGKHIGKVMIKIRDEEEDLHAKPIPRRIQITPQVFCEGNKSYVIVGGLGGFGLELADWLILRGAQNIVLSSRTGIKNGYQSYRIKLWRTYGVNVVISTENVTTEDGAKNLLSTAISLGSVAGIFNVALVLKDDEFSKQTEETFRAVAEPKAYATIHLDKLSRKLCPDLEHFVVFSSVSCGRGNLNQTNYGFSNSIMERICESRHSVNLPALAIQWGAIGEVGVVADFAENNLNIVIGGTLQQSVKSCLDSLDVFMKQSRPIVASMIVAEKRHSDTDIVHAVANILGIRDLKTINLTWTLPELGMDSILGVEIKQALEAEFNTFFTVQDLRLMTFAKLYKLREEKRKGLKIEEKFNTPYHKLAIEIQTMKKSAIFTSRDGKVEETPSITENPMLFILPGLEGLATFMEPLIKNLPVQICCFQYYHDEFLMDSLPKTAEYLANFILEKLDAVQEFCIAGYSVGGLFALEVVRILEEKGRKGYLWIVDSGPMYVSEKVTRYLNKKKMLNEDQAIQNHICIETIKSAAPEMASEEYFAHIEKAHSWEAKKKLIFSIVSQYSVKDKIIYDILENGYNFLKVFSHYKFDLANLGTPCTLIRAEENESDIDESFGLNECFKNPVQIHKIEACTHHTILGKPKTAEIIMDCPVWQKRIE